MPRYQTFFSRPVAHSSITCVDLHDSFLRSLRHTPRASIPTVRGRRAGDGVSSSDTGSDTETDSEEVLSNSGSGDEGPAARSPSPVRPRAKARANTAGATSASTKNDADPADAVSALFDPAIWMHVAHLGWRLKGDRVISEHETGETRERLKREGNLVLVRDTVERLRRAYVRLYPHVVAEDDDGDTLQQIIALGSEMAMTAALEPDILLFAKNDLQAPGLLARLLAL